MRIVRPPQAVVMVAFVLAVAGCSTTQPDSIEKRTASLSLNAQALVDIVNCWEVWQDQSEPPDGTPDVFLATYCEPPPAPFKDQRPVAWNYAISVNVIRAGSTTEEVVGSSIQPQDGVNDFISLTDYDPRVEAAPARPPDGNLYYRFPKQVSLGSSVFNNVGTPNVLGTPTPSTFDFDVHSGDTIIVRARKQALTALPPGVTPDQETNIVLSAVLAVNGVEVAVNGSKTTTGDDRAGISFSFTVR
jgi:hypothetical protein